MPGLVLRHPRWGVAQATWFAETLFLCLSVVTSYAQTLPVPAIPEQASVSSMWFDMINVSCSSTALGVFTKPRADLVME